MKIKMLMNVRSDLPFRSIPGTILRFGKIYDASANKNGAVCGKCENGEMIGVRPGEFEFVSLAGKNMPCDARLIKYKEDPIGPNYLVTDSGKLVRCRYPVGIPDGLGRIPHWATCPNASQHRRPK